MLSRRRTNTWYGAIHLLALASFTLVLGLAATVHARESRATKTVVLVADPAVLPLARRLQQEIESLGLVVRFQPGESVATIRVASKLGGDVDMTVIDASGKTVTYQLVSPASGDPAASELIATRTVELLRAHLLKLTSQSAARPRAPAAPPPKPTPLPAPSRALLSISLGPAALFSEKFRPGGQLQAELVWLPLPHLGFAGAVLAPLAAPRLNTREGSVELSLVSYRLAPTAVLGSEASPVSLRVELGVEMNRLGFEGRALAPYRSATDELTTWAPFLALAPRFRAFKNLYLAPAFSFSWASPKTVVRVAGSERATFGRPASRIALLLELSWPGAMP